MADQLSLDFVKEARAAERRARVRERLRVQAEQPMLIPPSIKIDIGLSREPGLAEAYLSGAEPEHAAVWLAEVVDNCEPQTRRKWRFPAEKLDRLLWPLPPAQVALDAGAQAVARALWAHRLGHRPLQIVRNGRRLTGRSLRGDWPSELRVRDVPWNALLVLMDLQVPVTVTRDASALMNVRLSGRHIGTAAWAGSYVRIESSQPDMMTELAIHLPGLAFDGPPGTGRYRLPALNASRLFSVPSIRVPDEVEDHILRVSEKVEPVQPPPPFPFELHAFQMRDVARARQIARVGGGVLMAGDMGSGKGSSPDTEVLAPGGWRRYGDLRVGDEVIGRDGRPCEVTGVFPRGVQPMYRVTFSDRTSVEVDADHLWSVTTPRDRWLGKPYRVKSTEELAEGLSLRCTNGYRRWFIPMVEPVQHPTADLPVDPYLLGCLLGDGSISNSSAGFTSADQEILDEVEARLPAGMAVRYRSRYDYALVNATRGGRNPLITELRKLELMGKKADTKFVPEIYLRADVDQRLEVLRGLLDTDGSAASTRRGIEFSSASQQLSKDVADLVQSLGGTATVTVKQTTHLPAYRLYINLPADIQPFRLKRKADLWAAQRPQGGPTRAIEAIEAIAPAETICISVDAPDQLYVTEHHIVTHNTACAAALLALEDWWPVVVVCPLAALTAWMRQLDDMGRSYHLATNSVDEDRAALARGGFDALLVSYDRLHNFADLLDGSTTTLDTPDGPVECADWQPKAIVADELQYVRSPGSRRSKALRALAGHVPYRIGLTGTPIMNRLTDLSAQGAFLLPGEWSARGGKKDLSDVYVSDEPVKAAADHLGAFMVRRKMSDTGVTLPAANDWRVDVEITSAQREAIAKLEEDARRAKEAGDVKDKIHAFTLLHKQRRIVACPSAEGLAGGNPKADAMLELVERGVGEGKKSVVFFNYRDTFTDYTRALDDAGIGWVAITGSRSPAERAEAERRFHGDDDVWVILGSYGAMNAAVTLSPTGKLWIAEPHPDLGITSQARARVRRLNQTDPIDLISLVAPDTFDERIMELLADKRELFAMVVDGEDGADISALDTSLDDLLYVLTGEERA